MEDVTLLDGIYKDSQEKGKQYLLYLDVDRLVASCYEGIDQTPKKPRYGGWESTGIAGHSIGHWLSAASAMYAVTKDARLKKKLDYAVDELAHIQSFEEDGYVSGFSRQCYDNVFSGEFEVDNFSLGGSWVPWYSTHKIFAGLIDTYKLTGSKKALEVVTKLADWAVSGLRNLTDQQFQRMLICEHGGMNEAMADLYLLTGKEDYLVLAKRFCHQAVLEPLAEGIDDLEGKHANTQIPKVYGAAKLYEITGEQKYKDMALFFWEQVTKTRSYVIGGNSIGEHFGPANAETLGITTTETCNTYNMLKLTEYLFNWSHQSDYMDYYEQALYNHILSSQDPISGMKTYFVSSEPGHFKVYCSPDDSFWCCTGTGMENPARYQRNIFYREQDELYVNLFISSEINLEDKKITINQETAFPETEKSRLVFKEAEGETLTIQIRIPYWIAGEMTVTVNGKEVYTQKKPGYLTISREWHAGDNVEIELPMNLHLYQAKDNPKKQAVMYGPIVLAGALGTEEFPKTDILADHQELNNHPLIDVPALITEETDPNIWIKRVKGSSLTFETEKVGQPGNVKVTLIPFYALHHQRYTLYWNIMNQAEYSNFQDKEKEEQDKLRKITIDAVQPNEQQPEVNHDIQSYHSLSGYLNTVHRGWRDSRGEGFFSYQMKVDAEKPTYLLVTYNGSDSTLHVDGNRYERDFSIEIDGIEIAMQELTGPKPGSLFDVSYGIPPQLTRGKASVEVKFVSKEGKAAGGVYGLRTVNEEVF